MHGIEFYSGSRADETPRALWIGGLRLPVQRVLCRDCIGGFSAEEGSRRTFLVELEDGSIWKIREFPAAAGGWVLERSE